MIDTVLQASCVLVSYGVRTAVPWYRTLFLMEAPALLYDTM
jgi:hypothetical protein